MITDPSNYAGTPKIWHFMSNGPFSQAVSKRAEITSKQMRLSHHAQCMNLQHARMSPVIVGKLNLDLRNSIFFNELDKAWM